LVARAEEDRGFALERRVARLEFAQGATVVMRFPVRVSDGKDLHVITDVDVLSIEFDQKLRLHKTIIECKSVTGQKGEADRLLVLAGLAKFLRVNQAILVRNSVSGRGREIARQLGVDVWDSQQLEYLETPHVWMPQQFGPVAGEKYRELHVEAARTMKQIGDIPSSLLDYLRVEAFVEQPHRVLGTLVTLSDYMEQEVVIPERTLRAVMMNALLALSVAAVRTAGGLDALGERRVRNMIECGVVTGNPLDNQLLRVAESADALLSDQVEQVHDLYVAAGATRQEVNVASIRDAIAVIPSWIDRFMDLVIRCRVRADLGRDLPRVIQMACFDALLGDVNWTAPALDALFTAEHRQLMLVTLDTLREIVGPTVGVLDELRSVPFNRSPSPLADRAEMFLPPSATEWRAGESTRQSQLFSES